MANIVIKKRVNLEFLGPDYKDDYLEFKSIPISQFETLMDELDGMDNKNSLKITKRILGEQFINGKFQKEDVTKDDLDDFDIETLVACLELLTGQKQSPKV